MSTRKATASQGKAPGQMAFLTPAANKRKAKMVSIRVDEELLQQFQQAAVRAEAAGYELSMTALVHHAIRMALDEVERVTSEPEAQ